jgi:hypothetical protein
MGRLTSYGISQIAAIGVLELHGDTISIGQRDNSVYLFTYTNAARNLYRVMLRAFNSPTSTAIHGRYEVIIYKIITKDFDPMPNVPIMRTKMRRIWYLIPNSPSFDRTTPCNALRKYVQMKPKPRCAMLPSLQTPS